MEGENSGIIKNIIIFILCIVIVGGFLIGSDRYAKLEATLDSQINMNSIITNATILDYKKICELENRLATCKFKMAYFKSLEEQKMDHESYVRTLRLRLNITTEAFINSQ